MTEIEDNTDTMLRGTLLSISGCELQIVAEDAYSEPYVVAKSADGETITIPNKFLEALGYQSMRLSADGFTMIDAVRQAFLGLDKDPRLAPAPRAGQNYYSLAGSFLNEEEGVPLLAWSSAKGDSDSGWRLTLSGATQVTVSYAAWDSQSALDSLIEMMGDPEGVLTMAGITQPEITAQLSARMTAVSMRASRSLPRIDLPKVRKALSDAGVLVGGHSGRNKAEAARMRLLAVKVGSVKVPVAVAINPPTYPKNARPLTDTESRLPWNERQELTKSIVVPAREDWMRAVKIALEGSGWRVVDLPKPVQPWEHRDMEPLWVTRIDANTWSGLSAAAAREAIRLEMSRGGVL